HVGGLRGAPGAGPQQPAVNAAARHAGPGAAPVRRRARPPVPSRGPPAPARRGDGPPGPRRPDPHARPAGRRTGPGDVRPRRGPRAEPDVRPAGGRPPGLAGDRRYLPYRWFTEPEVRALHSPEEQEHHARQLVADLRAVAGRRPDDPAVGGLVGRLRAESAEFRRLWAEHEVAVRRADRKTMVHPRVGRMLMDCETLVTLDQRQMLVVLTPANTEARERLDLLHVLGTQDFPTA